MNLHKDPPKIFALHFLPSHHTSLWRLPQPLFPHLWGSAGVPSRPAALFSSFLISTSLSEPSLEVPLRLLCFLSAPLPAAERVGRKRNKQKRLLYKLGNPLNTDIPPQSARSDSFKSIMLHRKNLSIKLSLFVQQALSKVINSLKSTFQDPKSLSEWRRLLTVTAPWKLWNYFYNPIHKN